MTVVDASVWISFLLPDDVNHQATRGWLARCAAEGMSLVAPMILLVEIAGAISRRTDQPRLGQAAVRDALTSPILRLVDLDDVLMMSAADLAADLKLRGMDAVYVAVAQGLGIPLVTWDREQRDRGAQVVTTYTPAMSI